MQETPKIPSKAIARVDLINFILIILIRKTFLLDVFKNINILHIYKKKDLKFINKMDVSPKINDSWLNILDKEFQSDYFKKLKLKLVTEKEKHKIYPPGNLIFNAFDTTPFNDVKVVIIGQDPYHGIGQANGLCFSVNKGVPHPPSLINIFKEISNEYNSPYPTSGDLTPWAKQGVLLLNATLTVRKDMANSHQDIGWQQFTDAVIEAVSHQKDHVVFMLWGGFAKRKGAKIDKSKHLVLTSGHPSPLSANRGLWFGNNHFKKANEWLIQHNISPINWLIE